MTGYRAEMITIIKDNNRLLINSVSDPDQRPSIAFKRRNKQNVDTFIKNLREIKKITSD